jgi:hypothetical protein
MELLVLNKEFVGIDIIDIFESIIWTERYNGAGDFEIYAPVSEKLLNNVRHDYYLWSKDTSCVMIVEDVVISSDFENGARIIITGRSLESILDRRIVWAKTVLDGPFQTSIKKLIDDAIIAPTDTNRRIDNFRFDLSTDAYILAQTVEAQFTGENLYDVIVYLCDTFNIGFRITLDDTTNEFVFKLYYGVDRTYDQVVNPYVIFSPKYENLINSNYIESTKTLKTVALVAGELYDTTNDDTEAALAVIQAHGSTYVDVGLGVVRKTKTVNAPGDVAIKLGRREIFVDARDIAQNINGTKLTDTKYLNQLSTRGLSDLAKNVSIQSFEGTAETTHGFMYGTHYYMGDLVQIVNEYDFEGVVRVTEVVRSHSLEGETILPTFSKI